MTTQYRSLVYAYSVPAQAPHAVLCDGKVVSRHWDLDAANEAAGNYAWHCAVNEPGVKFHDALKRFTVESC